VSLLLETLPNNNLRRQQRAVNRLVRAALSQPDDAFLKALAAALLKQGSSGALAPQSAFTLLEWSCLLLEALPAEGGSKAAAKLLEGQANLLSVLYSSGPDSHTWQAAAKAVMRLLRVRPNLLKEYLAAAAATGSVGMVRAVLGAVLQRHNHQQQQQEAEDRQVVAAALLPVLCDQVLAGRNKPPPHLLAAYAPLLGVLTPAELCDKLLPAANRAMRRTPEPAIAALADLLQQVQLDLSSAAPELVTLLVQQLRAKEAVRGAAEAALAALAARVQDGAVGLQLVQQLSKLLGGSSAEGKVKVASERAALAAALAALSALPPAASDAASTAAATFCSTYYKEERECLGWLWGWLVGECVCGGMQQQRGIDTSYTRTTQACRAMHWFEPGCIGHAAKARLHACLYQSGFNHTSLLSNASQHVVLALPIHPATGKTTTYAKIHADAAFAARHSLFWLLLLQLLKM